MTRVVCVLGASSGIGRAVAAACLARGDTVHGIARWAVALDLPGLIAHPLDARDDRALDAALAGIGSLDRLVLTMNAGSATGPVAGLPLARIRAAFDSKVFPLRSPRSWPPRRGCARAARSRWSPSRPGSRRSAGWACWPPPTARSTT